MTSFNDKLLCREYSSLKVPTGQDLAIALYWWSQYSWLPRSISNMQKDLSVLLNGSSLYSEIRQSRDTPIWRGFSGFTESDIDNLLAGAEIPLPSPWFDHGLESWSTKEKIACYFAQVKGPFGVVLQSVDSLRDIAFNVSSIKKVLPQPLVDKYRDLQDLESELVLERQKQKNLNINDVYNLDSQPNRITL